MKANLIYFLTFLFFCFACDSSKKDDKNEEVIESSKIEKKETVYKPEIIVGVAKITLKLGKITEDSRIAYSYYKITDKSLIYEEEINKHITKTVAYEYEQAQKETNVELSHQHFMTVLNQFKRDYIEVGGDMLWSYYDSTSIDESYENFVQLLQSGYTFTGGAHGNGYFNCTLFSRETGEKLKLDDIISDIPKLTKIGDKYFRKEAQLGPNDNLEEAGFWLPNSFELNNNFYFEKDKMIFFYNQYEIAPYVMGTIQIDIPMKEIKSILKIQPNRTK